MKLNYQVSGAIGTYKLFLYYVDHIRAYHQSLVALHEQEESTKKNVIPDNVLDPQLLRDEQATLDASSLTLSKEGLDHLGLLVEILDYDLAGLFELRRQIEKGTLETIAFVDMWHLYYSEV